MIMTPLLMGYLLKYFDGRIDLRTSLLLGMCICASEFIIPTGHCPYMLAIIKLGMKMSLQCSGLMYKKAFRVKLSTLDEQAGGKLFNLMANDVAMLDESTRYIVYLVLAPLQVLAVAFCLVYFIDLSILAGFLVYFVVLPSQAILAKFMDRFK